MNDKRGLYAVVVVAIILLLLLARRFGATTVINNEGGDINIETPDITYNVPRIDIPRSGAWDWMQTTDLACGCDVGLWKEPVVIQQINGQITSYPSYRNIVQTIYTAAPAANYHFDVYTPPPPPSWHWEYGWNVKNEERMFPVTDDGGTYIGGKYSRKADAYGQHNQQTKTGSVNGPDLYLYGKHYVHDASKDWTRPSEYKEGFRDQDSFIRAGWGSGRPPSGGGSLGS